MGDLIKGAGDPQSNQIAEILNIGIGLYHQQKPDGCPLRADEILAHINVYSESEVSIKCLGMDRSPICKRDCSIYMFRSLPPVSRK